MFFFCRVGSGGGLTNLLQRYLGSVVRIVIVLKPQGPRFDPLLANYVYRTMLANNFRSLAVDTRINTHVQNVQNKYKKNICHTIKLV